jgi:hypothetical protein
MNKSYWKTALRAPLLTAAAAPLPAKDLLPPGLQSLAGKIKAALPYLILF